MKPQQSVRIFENPYLEKLTRVHPIVPLIVWTPIVICFGWRSFAVDSFTPSVFGLIAVFGFFIWTLTEYLLHRYVFHLKQTSAWRKKFYFVMHGNHHVVPNDPMRLVMPPAGSLIIGTILYLFFRAVLGSAWVDPFYFGFSIGYLTYDYTHYAVHHFKPMTRFGRWNKQHHMLHHFVEHDARWGVSSPLWDYVFRSLSSQRKPSQQKS
ncbi:MAG: sterol desaturase family protein [Oligoflexia bacterium]|nr:sterol desaturase family protein [Oligoflexia bacterium]